LSDLLLLRHTLATLAYRGGKAISGAPAEFASYSGAGSARTPARILAHIGDLLDWALSLAEGRQAWKDSTPLPWEEERQRFFAALQALDARLSADAPIAAPAAKLFQGPIADALSHVGQIAMLRRLAGCPIRGENYFKAEIAAGRLGPEQSARRTEFD
jgi:hypothetical protein